MFDDISKNADEFAASLNRLGQQAEEEFFDKVVRKMLFKILSQLVQKNPKETCRSAGSWMLDIDWSDWQLPHGDYRGVDLTARVKQIVAALPKSQKYVLYNNVEYISALENGHSKQRPNGFIAAIIAAAASEVESVTDKILE